MLTGNKVLLKREEQQRKSRHDLKIKSVKSVISSNSPISSTTRITNAKKIQMLEDKCTEIERENRILYEKMLKIKKKPLSSNKTPPIRSLNEISRKHRMQEIQNSNSQLSSRISRKQSYYRFNTERNKTEKTLSAISEFPSIVSGKNYKNKTSSYFSKKKIGHANVTGGNLLCRQGKVLGGKSYLMEVYKNSDNYRIVGVNLENSEMFMIHLLPSEVKQYCGNENEIKTIFDKVDILDGNLIIVETRSKSPIE